MSNDEIIYDPDTGKYEVFDQEFEDINSAMAYMVSEQNKRDRASIEYNKQHNPSAGVTTLPDSNKLGELTYKNEATGIYELYKKAHFGDREEKERYSAIIDKLWDSIDINDLRKLDRDNAFNMIQCVKCGSGNDPYAKVCSNCGDNLIEQYKYREKE